MIVSSLAQPEHATKVVALPDRRPLEIDRTRLAYALALTPLLAPFYSTLLFGRPWDIPFGLLATWTGGLCITLPGTFLFAYLRRRGWLEFAVLGAISSVPGMLLYARFPLATHLPNLGTAEVLAMAGWGAFSGAAYWLLAIAGDEPLRFRDLFDLGPPRGRDSA